MVRTIIPCEFVSNLYRHKFIDTTISLNTKSKTWLGNKKNERVIKMRNNTFSFVQFTFFFFSRSLLCSITIYISCNDCSQNVGPRWECSWEDDSYAVLNNIIITLIFLHQSNNKRRTYWSNHVQKSVWSPFDHAN
jgi:hypothetical protein